jgi:hypothetical protein
VDQIKDFCLENMKLKLPATRAILYICLSFLCFTVNSPCLIAGLLLITTGVANIFAQINQNEEAHEGTNKLPSSERSAASDRTNLLNGGNTFGTFV